MRRRLQTPFLGHEFEFLYSSLRNILSRVSQHLCNHIIRRPYLFVDSIVRSTRICNYNLIKRLAFIKFEVVRRRIHIAFFKGRY